MHNNKILYNHDWFTLNLRGRSTEVRPDKTLEKKKSTNDLIIITIITIIALFILVKTGQSIKI